MQITQHSSPNFGFPRGAPGRRGQQIDAIFFHISGGSFASTHSWIMQARAQATYHYLIDTDGAIHQYVRDEDAAWSQGVVNRPSWPLIRPGVNPNLHALSIARAGENQNNWTPEQMASSVWLARHLAGKHNIPLRRPHIAGHFEVDSVNRPYCPGRGFFDALIAALVVPEVETEKEARGMMNFVVINTDDDYVAAKRLIRSAFGLNGNGVIVHRESAKALSEAQEQDNIIIVGGSSEGLPITAGRVEVVSGTNWWLTMAAMGRRIGAIT